MKDIGRLHREIPHHRRRPKDALNTNASVMQETELRIQKLIGMHDGWNTENGYLIRYEMLHGTDKFTIVSEC
jgi:hypothetical protein